jgi:hypothetical protein
MGWSSYIYFLTGYLFTQVSKLKNEDEQVIDDDKNKVFENERLLNKTLFLSMLGFMSVGLFISRMFTLTFLVFMGMTIASHNYMVKISPEYQQYFSNNIAF